MVLEERMVTLERLELYKQAEKRAWHKLRRHGWRICRDDHEFFYYRGSQTLNFMFNHLDDEVIIELGRWVSVNDGKCSRYMHVIDEERRVPFADFQKRDFHGEL